MTLKSSMGGPVVLAEAPRLESKSRREVGLLLPEFQTFILSEIAFRLADLPGFTVRIKLSGV
jgi:hypothetical protein